LDYSKAFNSVPHLIEKLKGYGIGGNLLESFLHNWSHRVVLNGTESRCSDITSRVPQGSVLGPLLFVLYIKCQMGVFADDTKLYKIIQNICDAIKT